MINGKEDDPLFNVNQNVMNYKGIYYEEEPEQKFFEGGAHFSHLNLCQKLEEIILTLSPERRGNSIYDTPNLSNNSNTKAETRKIASDNSKEMIKKDKSLSTKKLYQNQRNNAINNLINNNSIVKNTTTRGIIKSINETYKKIQPKNLMYNNSLKLSDKVSSVKIHVNKDSSATKLYIKPNKCIIDLNIRKNLNLTLKSQKSGSISSSAKANNNEVANKIFKNQTNKIINLDLNKKININSHIKNITNSYNKITNNFEDKSKNKEKDKKKIPCSLNSILNITNNKSRNLQPKKNSLENKTADNVQIKIFATSQMKLEPNKTKDGKHQDFIINAKMASRNLLTTKICDEKAMISKPEQTIKVKTVRCDEFKKSINTSKTKIFKTIKGTDNFETTNATKLFNKNTFNISKKLNQNIIKNNVGSSIKVNLNQKDKSDCNKLFSNFLNFSKNLPLSKKN